MKNLHYSYCLIGVSVAAVLLVVLGVEASTLGILAVAVGCPLLMFVLMRTMMMGGRSASSHRDDQPAENNRVR